MRTKKFDGLEFEFYDSYDQECDANYAAGRLRTEGRLVRIETRLYKGTKLLHILWYREGRKRKERFPYPH